VLNYKQWSCNLTNELCNQPFKMTILLFKGARALCCFYVALVTLRKDLSVSDNWDLTVQLWGLYGSGFSCSRDIF
jgi:hypothetical protein